MSIGLPLAQLPYGGHTNSPHAAAPIEPHFAANRPLQAMVLIYALVWTWSVVDPVYRGSWILENLMTVATLAVLAAP